MNKNSGSSPRAKSAKLRDMLDTYRMVVAIGTDVLASKPDPWKISLQRPRDFTGTFVHPELNWREVGEGHRELGEACSSVVSLRQLMRDYLTQWQEGVGAAVEEFWKVVAERGVQIVRKHDVVMETLARGKILNPHQYSSLTVHFEDLQTCGKIAADEADRLNVLLDRFEDAHPELFTPRSAFELL